MIFKDVPGGVVVSLYVQPNAPKSEVVGRHGEALKIKIKAPPVDGKANSEIIAFFSDLLGVAKNKIEILKGDKSKLKKVFIQDYSAAELSPLLLTNK